MICDDIGLKEEGEIMNHGVNTLIEKSETTASLKSNSFKKKSKISLVIPVYNEEESLPILYGHLTELMNSNRYEFEIIFVNDGSRDNSFAILLNFQATDSRVKVVDLGRNFGAAAAFTAGIDYAEGDAVVLLNADLQDPPELVNEFLEKWEKGYDVVYAVRKKRKEIFLKRIAYSLFYRGLNWLSSTPMPLDAGCFGLMSREVINIMKYLREHNRYIPGIRSWVGFKQTGISYNRPPRFAGRGMRFRRLVKFALDGMFSFSIAPLNLISYVGFIISLSSFTSILFYLYRHLFVQTGPSGFATIICVLLFLGGMILLSLGVIGQYIARIYEEVRARPLYTVKQTHGWQTDGH